MELPVASTQPSRSRSASPPRKMKTLSRVPTTYLTPSQVLSNNSASSATPPEATARCILQSVATLSGTSPSEQRSACRLVSASPTRGSIAQHGETPSSSPSRRELQLTSPHQQTPLTSRPIPQRELSRTRRNSAPGIGPPPQAQQAVSGRQIAAQQSPCVPQQTRWLPVTLTQSKSLLFS